eukprot:scaffold90757_cov32-Tisochrysis_lutea.AAC.3
MRDATVAPVYQGQGGRRGWSNGLALVGQGARDGQAYGEGIRSARHCAPGMPSGMPRGKRLGGSSPTAGER